MVTQPRTPLKRNLVAHASANTVHFQCIRTRGIRCGGPPTVVFSVLFHDEKRECACVLCIVQSSTMSPNAICSMGAGEWSGRLVAIKTMVFRSSSDQVARAASETAIASNLAHPNMVATYCHDVHKIESSPEFLSGSYKAELQLHKLYLVQVSAQLSSLLVNRAAAWSQEQLKHCLAGRSTSTCAASSK